MNQNNQTGNRKATGRRVTRHRRVLLIIAGIVLSQIFVYVAGEWYRRIDYSGRFLDLYGTPVSTNIAFREELDNHRLYSVHLANDRGVNVDGYLKVPDGDREQYPALLLLGGVRTGRQTIDYIRNTQGVVLLALDYPYEGKTSRMSAVEFVSAIPRIRKAVIRTVPAAMMAVDYLLARDDVDPRRIFLVGGSVGALFVPAVAATDPRIAAAAMLFGAGDIQTVMRVNLELPGIVARPASWLGAILVSPVEPAKYIGRVAPRPVFMLNGTGDPRMPEQCSRILHDAAGDPKTVRWIDAGHVNIRDTKFHNTVARELVDWLVAQNLVTPENFISSD